MTNTTEVQTADTTASKFAGMGETVTVNNIEYTVTHTETAGANNEIERVTLETKSFGLKTLTRQYYKDMRPGKTETAEILMLDNQGRGRGKLPSVHPDDANAKVFRIETYRSPELTNEKGEKIDLRSKEARVLMGRAPAKSPTASGTKIKMPRMRRGGNAQTQEEKALAEFQTITLLTDAEKIGEYFFQGDKVQIPAVMFMEASPLSAFKFRRAGLVDRIEDGKLYLKTDTGRKEEEISEWKYGVYIPTSVLNGESTDVTVSSREKETPTAAPAKEEEPEDTKAEPAVTVTENAPKSNARSRAKAEPEKADAPKSNGRGKRNTGKAANA